MAHRATMMEAFDPRRPHDTAFQKTVAINDFYRASERYPVPAGQHPVPGPGPPRAGEVGDVVPAHPRHRGLDPPRRGVAGDVGGPALAENRVTLTSSGRIQLHYSIGSSPVHGLLVREARRMLRRAGYPVVLTHEFRNENTTHQCGTAVFGDDPRTSVLDPLCRSHDVDNLYVVDASFFPSSAAVNPGLTVIAQALRVADHLTSRFGWTPTDPGGPTP